MTPQPLNDLERVQLFAALCAVTLSLSAILLSRWINRREDTSTRLGQSFDHNARHFR